MGSTTSRMRVEKMIVAGAIAVGLAAGSYGIASAASGGSGSGSGAAAGVAATRPSDVGIPKRRKSSLPWYS